MAYRRNYAYRAKPSNAAYRAPGTKPTIKDPLAPANPKQLSYLNNLAKEREIGMDYDEFTDMVTSLSESGVLTMGWVSQHIDQYKALPKRTAGRKTGSTIDFDSIDLGYYTTGTGTDKKFFVVVKSENTGHRYAKRLMQDAAGKWGWEYDKGAISTLVGLTPLTIEEAAEWGHLHGRCIICNHTLETPESVKRGIGPVCAKRIKQKAQH